MEETLTRIAENLIGRIGGPLTLRLILQPTMATIFAVRAGLKDARTGRTPYGWTVFFDPAHRHSLLQEGWKDVGKVFLMAIVMDTIYQYLQFRWFYPAETLLVAILLAIVPYLLIRGPATRIARRRYENATESLR